MHSCSACFDEQQPAAPVTECLFIEGRLELRTVPSTNSYESKYVVPSSVSHATFTDSSFTCQRFRSAEMTFTICGVYLETHIFQSYFVFIET
eukprot:m.420073 g.420073  ORF g.420073 m.420073 type:complete len:92 (-) comp21313_c0_seq1:96-371(-)